jgi:hypothetical protein
MTQKTSMQWAGDRDDQSRRASRHVTRFGAATLVATSAARRVVVTAACSERRSDVLVPGTRPAQRQRTLSTESGKVRWPKARHVARRPANLAARPSSVRDEYRGATAGVFMHASVRALWS